MEPFIVAEANEIVGIKIMVVGIGNRGCNMIEHMSNNNFITSKK